MLVFCVPQTHMKVLPSNLVLDHWKLYLDFHTVDTPFAGNILDHTSRNFRFESYEDGLSGQLQEQQKDKDFKGHLYT